MEEHKLFGLKIETDEEGNITLTQEEVYGVEQIIHLHPSQLHQVITWLKRAQYESMSRDHTTQM